MRQNESPLSLSWLHSWREERGLCYGFIMAGRTAEQLKHLELVQANVARMYEAATSMKRFAVVGFALGGSMARYLKEPAIVGFTVAVIVALWVLDAKYLQAERSFRALYERTRGEVGGAEASFDLTPETGKVVPIQELGNWSTWMLYGPMLVLLAAIWYWADW